MEPMRLLVTDAAKLPLRQATAWLIMTFGRNTTMSIESTPKGVRIRNWCLGTLLGVLVTSVIGNLISDTIPNPINYVVRWLTGANEEAKSAIPQPRLEIFLADKSTPLDGSSLPVRLFDYNEHKNGFYFDTYMVNHGEADTGPLRFTYYLDKRLPKPEAANPTKEVGYGCELPGSIQAAGGGNLIPGASTNQAFGTFFGATVPVPEPGVYAMLIRIRNPGGLLLYQGKVSIQIPKKK